MKLIINNKLINKFYHNKNEREFSLKNTLLSVFVDKFCRKIFFESFEIKPSNSI